MSKRKRTTSDHATDRMLWAPLRLSVRGAGTQLRYGRLAGPARRVRGAPGSPGWVAGGKTCGFLAGSFRSGLTRSDGAGTGSRARPESESDLPHNSDRIGPYTQHLYPETCAAPAPCGTAGFRPARKTAGPGRPGKPNGPGKTPGPFG